MKTIAVFVLCFFFAILLNKPIALALGMRSYKVWVFFLIDVVIALSATVIVGSVLL